MGHGGKDAADRKGDPPVDRGLCHARTGERNGKKTVSIYDELKDTTFTKKDKRNGNIVYQAIRPGEKRNLDIQGTVTNEAGRTDQAAAAQFKIAYFVPVLDENGLPVGNVYVGNEDPTKK